VSDRASIEEIDEAVSAGNVLTFNYVVLLLCAALIACIGLATNSATVIIAAMLISPLMGPILGT